MRLASTHQKLLTQMVEQYRRKHGCLPQRIVLSPVALTAMAVQRTVAPTWAGIPVECREIQREDVTKSGPRLGIEVQGNQLVSFDLHR